MRRLYHILGKHLSGFSMIKFYKIDYQKIS